MEISEFELARILRTHTGQDANLGTGPLSIREALSHAANLLVPNMTSEKSRKAAGLVKRLIADSQAVRLEAEDIIVLKTNAPQCLAPFVYDQIHDILEPPAKPGLKMLGHPGALNPQEIPKTE